MAKAKPNNNAAAFRSLEAKFAELCRLEPQTTEATTKAQTQKIARAEEAICDLANSAEPDFGARFIGLLQKRWRSSGDAIEYLHARDRLRVRFSEISAEKQKQALEEARRQHAALIADRDRQWAKEYLQKRNLPSNKHISDSALMAGIGKRQRKPVGRSAAIAAIKRGLKAPKA